MATEKKILSVFQFRRDHTENWLLNKDEVPAAGEPCYDIDLRTLRIGDGKTTYENLPVIGNVDTEVVNNLQTVVENKADIEAVETLETELKIYVDEQIKTVEVTNNDYGEI